jgi:hypothetical protein
MGGTTMKRIRTFARLCVVLCLCWAGSVYADAVTDWNMIAIDTINASAALRPTPSAFLDTAMVHLAIHDAVAAIDGRFRPYHVRIPGASGSQAAAAAKAAHDVLVNRFPLQAASLDLTYDEYLSAKGLRQDDPGVAVGRQAAANIIAFRANDGSFPSSPPFNGGTANSMWRPTPPAFAPMSAPWMADVKPFALISPSQFLVGHPPSLTSDKYTQDYNDVKALGARFNSARTPEQTDFAYFWFSNYLVLWNQVLRNIAGAHVNNLGESARLFALANMAMADAVITAWKTKITYVFWRPSTAIQEGDNDGNRHTVGDPNWQPLIDDPPYPDYTSGANNVTGAATRTLHLFFGRNRMTFQVTTTNPLAIQQTRTYHSFSDAARDVVIARVYEGIHFLFSDKLARSQGQSVAKWVFKHFLRPVDDRYGEDEDNEQDEDVDYALR